jgi:hypothetical protein
LGDSLGQHPPTGAVEAGPADLVSFRRTLGQRPRQASGAVNRIGASENGGWALLGCAAQG